LAALSRLKVPRIDLMVYLMVALIPGLPAKKSIEIRIILPSLGSTICPLQKIPYLHGRS
jgi:hypothetical protein